MKPHYYKPGVYEADMSDLIGETFTEVRGEVGSSELLLRCAKGVFRFYHDQDCCESVCIQDITGDIADLLESPILMAEEATSRTNPPDYTPEYQESFTWTFYKLATIKGYVDIRWLGESNGYYSEAVDIEFIPTVDAPKEGA